MSGVALQYQDITNITTSESSALDDRGYSRPTMRTTFKVRGQGPYWVELPKQGWTASAADAAVRDYATEIVALIDKYPE